MSYSVQGLLDASILIAGEWQQATGPAIAVTNSANGETVAELPSASPEQVQAALKAADEARYGWARTAPSVRAQLVRDMARVLRESVDELAPLIMWESGKTQATSAVEVEVSAIMLEVNAEWALRVEGEVLPSDAPTEIINVLREPLGVVVAICPWNWPLATWARKFGPALTTGNTVIAKPSEVTPLSTVRAMQIITEKLDVPPGVIGLLTGGGDVGGALSSSPVTNMVTFTGHRDTGKKIMAAAAANLTRVALELGGKAAAIVLADADIDRAVEALIGARFANAGEMCGCAERILVERPVYDEFVAKYVTAAGAIEFGDPERNLMFGPLANADHLAKVSGAVEKAKSEGAVARTGGSIPTGGDFDKGGYYYPPTVLTNVTPDMSIAIDETFGPVIPVIPIDSFEEGLKIANDTRYGLAGYLYTSSYAKAMVGARDFECGELFINRTVGEALHAHHSGHKESGIGGEDGKHGILKYTQLKVVYHNW
ncbi:MAG: aldehyde dehydrogenase [Marmoricola sp.]|nr:aldehyde dehydrogenase [Marmoricola sp.]